jgi:hypothetical protein
VIFSSPASPSTRFAATTRDCTSNTNRPINFGVLTLLTFCLVPTYWHHLLFNKYISTHKGSINSTLACIQPQCQIMPIKRCSTPLSSNFHRNSATSSTNTQSGAIRRRHMKNTTQETPILGYPLYTTSKNLPYSTSAKPFGVRPSNSSSQDLRKKSASTLSALEKPVWTSGNARGLPFSRNPIPSAIR